MSGQQAGSCRCWLPNRAHLRRGEGSDAHHACELGRRWKGRELVERETRSTGRELAW